MQKITITAEDFFKRLEEDNFGHIEVSVDLEVTIDVSIITW